MVELTKSPLLAYFDPKADHIIQGDGSMKGISALLLQKCRPIVYASKNLTPAETGYSSIEKELLSVVFALEDYITMCWTAKSRYRLTTNY